MLPIDFIFYIFSLVTIVAASLVIFSNNSVHSVLWLILSFISAAGLFVLLNAEFIAMLLVVVYVGAVAVLFLFVVMMLNSDPPGKQVKFSNFIPVGIITALVIFVELTLVFGDWNFADNIYIANERFIQMTENNTESLGKVLYTDYFLSFQIAGIILLVAMVGAIVLTLSKRDNVKRQGVIDQMYRDSKDAVSLKDVKPGQGL